jgi:RNA polymerase sigma-70 factor (ECF subfamily)
MAHSFAWTLSGQCRPDWDLSVVRSEPEARTDQALVNLDEAALVQACLAGRTGAFDLVVERHRRTVYQLCYRFAGIHEDASDLSQDVFIRAYRGLSTFRGQSSLATWLYRIGVNVCLNRVSAKTLRTEPIEEGRHGDAAHESPIDQVLAGKRAAHVRRAIARLPHKQRATLILRMYHDLPHQQIAEILGSSVGAVKANLFHALVSLKRLLLESEVG